MYEDILGPKNEIKHRKFKLENKKEEVSGLKGRPVTINLNKPEPEPDVEEIDLDLWEPDEEEEDDDETDEDEDDIGKKSPIYCEDDCECEDDCANKCNHGC